MSHTLAGVILVTGGAGFIGSHIVDELVAAGHEVRILDSLLAAAHVRRPDYLNHMAELVEGDIRDPSVVDAALDGVDAVCHQAAMVGLGLDILDVEEYVSQNALGTAVLLKRMAMRGFDGRLVLASSMVVYGEGAYRCAGHGRVMPAPRALVDLAAGRFEPRCPQCGGRLESVAVAETSPLDPRNVYAATKAHQEHLCFVFARETGVPVTALRYHNVYGPRMPRDTPYAGVAAIFASSLAAGRAPRVFEDGGQLRDFVHVRDVARANVIALTRDDAVAGVFNVATGTPTRIGEMAQVLADAAGGNAPRPVVTGEYRLGDVRHVFASPERARQLLGFTATEDFRRGMKEFGRAPLRA
ncbi:MAG: NAD-dependent epimerase/dehydratase family protein [Solirubrobacteraceae bacterium]